MDAGCAAVQSTGPEPALPATPLLVSTPPPHEVRARRQAVPKQAFVVP